MISELKVMSSAAGYYVGREFLHEEGWQEPYSRESAYFKTQEEAWGELGKILANEEPLPENILTDPSVLRKFMLKQDTNEKWNRACMKIKTANGGKYPSIWYESVIKHGIRPRN